MKRSLLRLYPRSWRCRYEEEFECVLEQRGRHLGDAIDIVRGALDARLSELVPGAPGNLREALMRVGGLSLIAAGVLWILGIMERNWYLLSWNPVRNALEARIGADIMRAYIPLLLLLGLAGLWAYGRTRRDVASLLSLLVLGMMGGLAVYDLIWAGERFLGLSWYSLALTKGLIAFGMGCFCLMLAVTGTALARQRVLPRWSMFLLVLAALGVVALVGTVLVASPEMAYQVVYRGQVYLALAFGLAWIPLGVTLLFRPALRHGAQ